MLLPPGLLPIISGVLAFAYSLKVGLQGKTKLPAALARVLTDFWGQVLCSDISLQL